MKNWRTKAARQQNHREMMMKFIEFLNQYYPAWQQHMDIDDPRYADLLAAFKAGWQAA